MKTLAYVVIALFAFGMESFFLAIANAGEHDVPAEYWVVGIVVLLNAAIAVITIRTLILAGPKKVQLRRQNSSELVCGDGNSFTALTPIAVRPAMSSSDKLQTAGCMTLWVGAVLVVGGMGIFMLWGWWYRYVEHPVSRVPGLPLARLLMLPLFVGVAAMCLYAAGAIGSPIFMVIELVLKGRRRYLRDEGNLTTQTESFVPDESGELDLRAANHQPWATTGPHSMSTAPELPQEMPMEIIKLLDNCGKWGNGVIRERYIKSGDYLPLWDKDADRTGMFIGIAILVGFPMAMSVPIWLLSIKPWGAAVVPGWASLTFFMTFGAPALMIWSRMVAARNRPKHSEIEFLAELPINQAFAPEIALAVRRVLALLAGTVPEAICPTESAKSFRVFCQGRPLLIEFAALLCDEPDFRNDPVTLAQKLAAFPRGCIADLVKAVATSGYYVGPENEAPPPAGELDGYRQ